ncbi:Lsr2 family protein [Streptomyces adustus]|uniref:Lsr2 family protein n=1 Tax=Streptomyces adustus TaxID=1609272 RepID=A0A5N8VCI1_9ACTN|nr:Lsr2 family protein [Streptomyces adustus]MPY32961.1 Lsr2 family protein [Streptomyces adustus]
MAQKIVTVYTDDLTGVESHEVQTHTFSLDGVNYEIDLVSENYDKLFEALEPFIVGGRKVGRTKRAGRSQPQAPQEPSAEELRTWARENDLQVNERGRVPASIREAYAKAH